MICCSYRWVRGFFWDFHLHILLPNLNVLDNPTCLHAAGQGNSDSISHYFSLQKMAFVLARLPKHTRSSSLGGVLLNSMRDPSRVWSDVQQKPFMREYQQIHSSLYYQSAICHKNAVCKKVQYAIEVYMQKT